MGVFQKLTDAGINGRHDHTRTGTSRVTPPQRRHARRQIVTDELVKQRLFAVEELARLQREHEAGAIDLSDEIFLPAFRIAFPCAAS